MASKPIAFSEVLFLAVLVVAVSYLVAAGFSSWYNDKAAVSAIEGASDAALEHIVMAGVNAPVKVALSQCTEQYRSTPRHRRLALLDQAADDPRHRKAPRDWRANFEPLTRNILAQCSSQFVLAAGTVDEMLLRTELLASFLPDGFRDTALALALNAPGDQEF